MIGSKLNIHLSTTEITTLRVIRLIGNGNTKFISSKIEIVLIVGPMISVTECVFFDLSVIFLNFAQFLPEMLIFMSLMSLTCAEFEPTLPTSERIHLFQFR
jgi:hypothetical protein